MRNCRRLRQAFPTGSRWLSRRCATEGRVPFLDCDLVLYSFRLSPDLKLPAGGTEKRILRRAAEGCLPPRRRQARSSSTPRRHFPAKLAATLVGRTRSVAAGEIA